MQKISSKTDKLEQIMEKHQEDLMKSLEHWKFMLQNRHESSLKLMEQYTKHLNLNPGRAENSIP